MKAISNFITIRLLVVVGGILAPSFSDAAILSLNMDPSDPAAVDPAYPGSGSIISTRTDNQTGVTVAISGRNYGDDPAPGAPRWGLRIGPLPGNGNQDGFVVSSGFQPAAPGSTQNASGTGASYISVSLSNVQPNTLFQNLSIDFQGLSATRTTNAWGAASVGGFANWSVATVNGGQRRLSLDLADFTWTGSGPLEIRLYGLTGLDEGAFTMMRIHAQLTSVPAVPEPGAALLLGLGLAVLCTPRRRRAPAAVW